MSGLVIGLPLALSSAVAINWGQVVQHGEANSAPEASLRHLARFLRALASSPRWLSGFAAGWLGWGLFLVALHFAPLSLVQASAGTGVGVVAYLSQRVHKVALARSERVAAVVAIVGAVSLGASLVTGTGSTRHPGVLEVTAGSAVFLALALGAWALAGRVLSAGGGLGAVAGCCYAAADVASKSLLSGGSLTLIPVVLACSMLAFLALQRAFQRGGELETIGTSTLVGNAFPVLAGLVLFGDELPAGPLGALRIVGFCGVILGITAFTSQARAHDRRDASAASRTESA